MPLLTEATQNTTTFSSNKQTNKTGKQVSVAQVFTEEINVIYGTPAKTQSNLTKSKEKKDQQLVFSMSHSDGTKLQVTLTG